MGGACKPPGPVPHPLGQKQRGTVGQEDPKFWIQNLKSKFRKFSFEFCWSRRFACATCGCSCECSWPFFTLTFGPGGFIQTIFSCICKIRFPHISIFWWGCLPFWSSSILVVFYFGRLPFWSSSILVIFHFGRLPFWSSSILVVFHFSHLPFWSSSILVV